MMYRLVKFLLCMLERFRVLTNIYSSRKMILVHQMGKVGSTAIEGSLRDVPSSSTYHTHFLNLAKITEVDAIYQKSGNWRFPRHLAQSYALNRHIETIKKEGYVISMVRDPIGRIISSYFQDIIRLRPYLVSGGRLDIRRAIDELMLIFEELDQYGSSWFEHEINDVFGINVYAYPFDKERHCLCVKSQNIRLLIIRMEDLSLDLEVGRCISDFIGVTKPIKLLKLNVGQEKWYVDAYNEVKNKIVTNDRFAELLTSIYDHSQYITHFYDEEERDSLKRKWLIKSSMGSEKAQ